MSRHTFSGTFIVGGKGPVFVLLRRPAGPASGCVLVVPPFAEEMNKCRRMVTELAIRLAEQGIATLQPDFYGTGDSAGDFADADIGTWVADLAAAVRWSEAEQCPVNALLAIRLGAALACEALQRDALGPVARSVLWQPVFDGGRFLTQFLRLRTAASLMEDRKESVNDLRAALAAGQTLEVAGYELSAALARDLESLVSPALLPANIGETAWLEVVRESEAPLPPPSLKLIEQTRQAGGSVQAMGFAGEPFWSSTEIVVNQPLVSFSLAHIGGRGPG